MDISSIIHLSIQYHNTLYIEIRGMIHVNPDVEGTCPCCAGLASLARVPNPDRREESHVGARYMYVSSTVSYHAQPYREFYIRGGNVVLRSIRMRL